MVLYEILLNLSRCVHNFQIPLSHHTFSLRQVSYSTTDYLAILPNVPNPSFNTVLSPTTIRLRFIV